MMKKIRQAQNSWFTKTILFLTGLSFMSLFGIAGYVGSAGKNKPIITVDNYTLLQSEFATKAESEMSKFKSILGDKFDENIKLNLLKEVLDKNLNDLIIKRTADKLNIHISDDEIRRAVFPQPEFKNEQGIFDVNLMRRILLLNGMTEGDYLEFVRSQITKGHILTSSTDVIPVPSIMAEYMAKAQKQKKQFDYIKIDTSKTAVDRKISQEELEQYYNDFIANFTIPESRKVDFIFISTEDIMKDFVVTDAEIDEIYNSNKEKYEVPEKRAVLQIIFDTEEDALKAKAELDKGTDFLSIAKKYNQTKEDVDLGVVTSDMLVEEISSVAFGTKKNIVSKPIKTDFGWNVIKVTNIIPSIRTSYVKVKKEIIDEIRQDKSYTVAQELTRSLDDRIAEGATLVEIAKELNVVVNTIAKLQEDGKSSGYPKRFTELVSSDDFVNMAFGYGTDEVSQIIDNGDGLIILSVRDIVDAHPKEISVVKNEIIKLWEENEKTAIVQNIIEDVVHDVESGDNLYDIAKRFSLSMSKTKPLNRTENFENISAMAMQQLFQVEYDIPKVIDMDNIKIIVVAKKITGQSTKISKEDISLAKNAYSMNLVNEYSRNLLGDFASDYNVKIEYRELNLYQ